MSLVGQAKDMGIAEALLESGLAKGLDLISRYQEEESLPRAPAKFETASDVGLWLFQNPRTRESLELFHPYREQLETAYAESMGTTQSFSGKAVQILPFAIE
jgi:hypothetical protein